MQLALLIAAGFVTGFIAAIPVLQTIASKTKNTVDDKIVGVLASHKADMEALVARLLK